MVRQQLASTQVAAPSEAAPATPASTAAPHAGYLPKGLHPCLMWPWLAKHLKRKLVWLVWVSFVAFRRVQSPAADPCISLHVPCVSSGQEVKKEFTNLGSLKLDLPDNSNRFKDGLRTVEKHVVKLTAYFGRRSHLLNFGACPDIKIYWHAHDICQAWRSR